jgi:group II intron reverse transcriptase/maturase
MLNLYSDLLPPVDMKPRPIPKKIVRKMASTELYENHLKMLDWDPYRRLCEDPVIWMAALGKHLRKESSVNINAEGISGVSIDYIKQIMSVMKNPDARFSSPIPNKRVFIPKKNGKLRPLGIPTAQMKMVQEAINLAIREKIYNGSSELSIGYKRGNSSSTMLKIVKSWKKSRWIIEGDIKSYFDNIRHDILCYQLSEKGINDVLIGKILSLLKHPFEEGDNLVQQELGVPQGGLLSPLLANLYLEWLDLNLLHEFPGIKYVRYADDWLVGCKDKREAYKVLLWIEKFLKENLFLELNRERTKITLWKRDPVKFLGYNLRMNSKYNGTYSPKMLRVTTEDLGDKIRELAYERSKIKRKTTSIAEAEYLGSMIRGVMNYYLGPQTERNKKKQKSGISRIISSCVYNVLRKKSKPPNRRDYKIIIKELQNLVWGWKTKPEKQTCMRNPLDNIELAEKTMLSWLCMSCEKDVPVSPLLIPDWDQDYGEWVNHNMRDARRRVIPICKSCETARKVPSAYDSEQLNQALHIELTLSY